MIWIGYMRISVADGVQIVILHVNI